MYERVEALLEARGISAYELAKAIGIPSGTLSNWKYGRYTPKIDKIQRIADYFSVPVDYIMGKDDSSFLADAPAQYTAEPKEYSMLMEAARDAKAEDILVAYNVLIALKRKER